MRNIQKLFVAQVRWIQLMNRAKLAVFSFNQDGIRANKLAQAVMYVNAHAYIFKQLGRLSCVLGLCMNKWISFNKMHGDWKKRNEATSQIVMLHKWKNSNSNAVNALLTTYFDLASNFYSPTLLDESFSTFDNLQLETLNFSFSLKCTLWKRGLICSTLHRKLHKTCTTTNTSINKWT